ncbi:MAG TPA: response regulator transcription factor [Candidatus Sulfotelmatobacter sp.]|nr:response regulator transcription factor [Candidatus Sulfotelmatobacter sp.]
MTVRILIADDNAPVRAALRRLLEESAPWEVLEAENGEDCLAKARQSRPHLIVLDLAMPKMDGMRAARALNQMLPETPVIMHTLHYTPRVAVEALKAGVAKVVPKADRSTILSAIQEVLESKQMIDRQAGTSTPSAAKSSTSPEPSPAGPNLGPLSVPSVEERSNKRELPPPDAIVPKG